MLNTWSFFAFPLNLLLALLWAWGWIWLWKRHPKNKVLRFMLSPSATVSAIVLLIISCIWLGVTGNREFAESICFVAVLLYIQTVLLLVTLRGWKAATGKTRWRFLFLHAGLLLAVGSGFWGAPDSLELRVALERGQETQTAYTMGGNLSPLGYAIKMLDFNAEYSIDGKPSDYEAIVSIDEGDSISLCVNSPYSVSAGEDVYLASATEDYCILQIVREPWKYFALSGILMLIAGAFMLFIKGPGR